jgi:hypothetical protein
MGHPRWVLPDGPGAGRVLIFRGQALPFRRIAFDRGATLPLRLSCRRILCPEDRCTPSALASLPPDRPGFSANWRAALARSSCDSVMMVNGTASSRRTPSCKPVSIAPPIVLLQLFAADLLGGLEAARSQTPKPVRLDHSATPYCHLMGKSAESRGTVAASRCRQPAEPNDVTALHSESPSEKRGKSTLAARQSAGPLGLLSAAAW